MKDLDVRNLPTACSLLVTENCNMGCEYCFEHHKKNVITKEVIHATLDYLSTNAKKIANGEGFHVMIFGGEPLLYPKLVQEILDYGLKLQEEKDIKFTATLITNATMMNSDVFYLLADYKNKMNLSCQLSIDGNEKSQNMYRKLKGGKPSFDLIEKNISLFKKAYQDKPWALSIHSCINQGTLPHMFENYKFFREEWNMQNIWFMPIHEEKWTDDDVLLYEKQLELISDYMIDKAMKEQSLSEIKIYSPLNACFNPYKKQERPCGAGKNFITVTSNGDIYPCHVFYFNDDKKEFLIGNIFDEIKLKDELRQDFLGYSTEKLSCPSDCDNTICRKCMGINWIENGDPMKQVRGNYCKMSRLDKAFSDKLKKIIPTLPFVDLEDKKYWKFEKSWVQDNKNMEKWINVIGEEIIEEEPLNDEQIKQVEDYYQTHALEIIAGSIKILLEKVSLIEKNQKELYQQRE